MEHRGESAIANYQGAFICWMLKGFRGKLIDECRADNSKRNIITAYVMDVLIVVVFVYLYVTR